MARLCLLSLLALMPLTSAWAESPPANAEQSGASALVEGADGSATSAADPARPLIDALIEVSARLRSTPYASSSDAARLNTERFLSGLFAQAWDFSNQRGQLHTPYFGRSYRIEGMPGLYNPDNVYRSALLEPDGVYRVYGQRGTHADLSFQILDQYPVVGLGKNLLVIRPEEFGVKPGQSFEFYLGGSTRIGKRWFALPRNAAAVLARQSFGDWRETPSNLFVERIDQPVAAGYQNQFSIAATALRQATKLWVDGYIPAIERSTKVNELSAPRGSDTSSGGLGGQLSVMARYRIGRNEALLITVRKANVAYQGIQLGDPWFVTPNTLMHQISLTAKQARIDGDGFIRFVISLEDPGVPNWLDAAGNPEGFVFMRWQGVKAPLTAAEAPIAKLVPLASLRAELPADTPVISEAARRSQIAERKWVPQVR
jgi:hypothetical protein